MIVMDKIKFLLLESDRFYRKRRPVKVNKLARIQTRKLKSFEIWRFVR